MTEQKRAYNKAYGLRKHINSPIIECGCGCGVTLKSLDLKGKPRKFLVGHNAKSSKEDYVNKFWSMVCKTPTCWNWTGGTTQGGYGTFKINNKDTRVHRFGYELQYEVSPGDLMVCHTCDNPSCVRKEHLFLGTAKDNIDDMVSKGRKVTLRGIEIGNSKLYEEDVVNIRVLSSEGLNYPTIAERYNVTKATIHLIVKRKRWKHVK